MNNKKILVLGGTQMVGRDFIETAKEQNNLIISLANRGLTNKKIFTDLENIYIDRNNRSLCSNLTNRLFDIVVDFSCYNIDQYKNTIGYINCKKYILISTQSVLDSNVLNKKDIKDPYYWYCYNKKELENYILSLNNDTIIVRPGAIYGHNDYTNRFEYREDNFYWKNTNIIPSESNGCVYVKKFSLYLLDIIRNITNYSKYQILQIP
jgi:nucleoside-diphosphate-sugar epimerase